MTHKPQPLGPINPEGLDEIARQLLEGTLQSTIVTPATINNPKNYIILPATSYCPKDLLIAKQHSHLNETWNQCQEALPRENHFMLPPRQFVDFLNLLQTDNVYDGSGTRLSTQERTTIFNDITEKRDPYRAEQLNAQYSKQGDVWHITYHKIQPNGFLIKVTEPLEACLMQNKTLGISLEDWLSRATPHGLPPPDVKSGSLWYWSPQEGTVSRFRANSDRVNLNCNEDPQNSKSKKDEIPGLGIT